MLNNNSYTVSEATGEILHSLHTAFRSDHEIVDRLYGGMASQINGNGFSKKAIRIATRENKSFLYLLSDPHREMTEKFTEELTMG